MTNDDHPIGTTGDEVPRSGDWRCMARGCSTVVSLEEGEMLPTCGDQDVRWVYLDPLPDEEEHGDG